MLGNDDAVVVDPFGPPSPVRLGTGWLLSQAVMASIAMRLSRASRPGRGGRRGVASTPSTLGVTGMVRNALCWDVPPVHPAALRASLGGRHRGEGGAGPGGEQVEGVGGGGRGFGRVEGEGQSGIGSDSMSTLS